MSCLLRLMCGQKSSYQNSSEGTYYKHEAMHSYEDDFINSYLQFPVCIQLYSYSSYTMHSSYNTACHHMKTIATQLQALGCYIHAQSQDFIIYACVNLHVQRALFLHAFSYVTSFTNRFFRFYFYSIKCNALRHNDIQSQLQLRVSFKKNVRVVLHA